MTKSTRGAAFFDLDGTLVTVNGGRSWIEREHRLGRMSSLQLLTGMGYLGLYYFGLIDIDRALGQALGTVKGMPEEQLRQDTKTWFTEEIIQRFAPGARPFLDAHKSLGHPLVVLTSSSPYAAALACEYFGLDVPLSTHYAVEGGNLTGDFHRPACYGAGKIHHAKRFAAMHDVDLAASYFYTDSNTDLPMMEAVGYPRAVNADIRLRRIARRRGWPLMDWSQVDDGVSVSALDVLKCSGR